MTNIPSADLVPAAFRIGSCKSSGSEHSADLSDMVNSFVERDIWEYRSEIHQGFVEDDWEEEDGVGKETVAGVDDYFELEESLKNLLFDRQNDDDGAVRRTISEEVEIACDELGGSKSSSPEFKRRLMAKLRSRGLDAGLCKSKWEKNGQCPSGDYEYIDVNAAGTRYIVEVFLSSEFTTARQSSGYSALLRLFPAVFVGNQNEIKQVVRLMCRAFRKSLKTGGIHVPPWRRLAYMQLKWFGSYKRTLQETPSQKMAINVDGDVAGASRLVGFAPPFRPFSFNCRQDFAMKVGVRRGNLAAALN